MIDPKPGDPRVPLNQKQKEAQEKYQEETDQARKALERVGSTKDGLNVLQFIYGLTGMRQSPVIINKQSMMVSEKLSMLIAGRQEVWRDLQQFLSPELTVNITCPEYITGGKK